MLRLAPLVARHQQPLIRQSGLRPSQASLSFQRPTGLAVGLAQERSRSGQVPPRPVRPVLHLGPPSAPGPTGCGSAIRAEVYHASRRNVIPPGGRWGRLRRIDASWLASALSTPPSRSPSSSSACSSAGASATSSTSRSAAARALRRSSSTRVRRPRTGGPARTTCWRASSRTSSRATRRCAGTSSPRKARLGLPRPAGGARGGEGARLHNKHDIERFGIAEFNAKCRESVLRYIDEWNELTERIGFWIDTDDAYFTLDERVRGVGLVVAEAGLGEGPADRGPQGRPVLPALRHGALVSHELALGYKDVVDPSVFVKFPLRRDPASAARLDHDALDAPIRTRRSPFTRMSTYVRVRARRRGADPGRGARGARAGRGSRDRRRSRARSCEGTALRAAVSRTSPTTASAATPSCPPISSRPRTAPASCTPASPSARTTSGSARSTG